MKIKILLYRTPTGVSFFDSIIGKVVTLMTGHNISHSGIMIDGITYEITETKRDNKKAFGVRKGNLIRDPAYQIPIELTKEQELLLVDYLESTLDNWIHYNIPKVIILPFIYFMRKIFKPARKWKPFAKDSTYGEICSAYVDTAFKKIGVDLLPNKGEEYTLPSDFLNIKNHNIESYI